MIITGKTNGKLDNHDRLEVTDAVLRSVRLYSQVYHPHPFFSREAEAYGGTFARVSAYRSTSIIACNLFNFQTRNTLNLIFNPQKHATPSSVSKTSAKDKSTSTSFLCFIFFISSFDRVIFYCFFTVRRDTWLTGETIARVVPGNAKQQNLAISYANIK